MTAPRSSRVTIGPDRGHPDRTFRAALLATWRQLRLSVMMGRPITLPNLVRLYRRKVSVLSDRMPEPEFILRMSESVGLLTSAYRRRQPFGYRGERAR